MRSNDAKLREETPCLLEIVKSLEHEGKPTRLEDVASELGRPLVEVKRTVEKAVREGLVRLNGDFLRITEKGRERVRVHRERYVHDRHVHRRGLLGGISRLFEGRIRNWREHWRSRHGLNDAAIEDFYRSVQDLKGRIEETIPLTGLSEGERARVAYVIGGYGMVRRLAEMGLTPGTEVRVLRHGLLHGPVQIEARGVCLALGYGVASRVFVKHLR